MVREARFLWSDPFEDPQRSEPEAFDDFDDLDLTPLKPSRKRRRSQSQPDELRRAVARRDWPPHIRRTEGGTP